MRKYLILWLDDLGIPTSPIIVMLIALCFIILFSIIIHLFLHRVVLSAIKKQHQKSPRLWSQLLLQHHLFNRLAFVLQGGIIYVQTQLWLISDTRTYDVVLLCVQIWILVSALLALFSVLDTLLSLLQHTKVMQKIPFRGIFQSIKLISAIMVGILIISLLFNRSPLLLFSGLGAMTAVFMLVFKDPILGLVAGIQLSANNMLNVGDWLEMPKYGADGDVIDIGLTTVKVSNWDKTITTIPTYALISDSFKNWRGMTEAGGRRIKRSINIDTSSIHFLTDAECERLRKAQLLLPYIDNKIEEISHYNRELQVDLSSSANGRRLTNIGTFRAYLHAYLHSHPGIHKEMTLIVRQLSPTPEGLPIEIYAFTNTTAWANYEDIQSDIFDHILAVVAEFDLRVHQTPTGNDMRSLSGHLAAGVTTDSTGN